MAAHEGSTEHRMWLFNQYHQAIADEVVPAIHADSSGPQPVVVGRCLDRCVQRPRHDLPLPAPVQRGDLHERHLRTSSSSSAAPTTDDWYFSSPLHFLPGLEGPALEMLRHRYVVLASGSGDWEDVGESWAVANALGDKGIPNRVDDWGAGYDHDWPTWWEMLPLYLDDLVP